MPIADWLSTTWEPNWRSFQYFNLYRLVAGAIFWLSFHLPGFDSPGLFLATERPAFDALPIYLLLVSFGGALAIFWRDHFNRQLTFQVLLDVAAMTFLVLALRGKVEGPGVLMLISLAGASLVGKGRLVLFYAALAAIGVLAANFSLVWQGALDAGAMFSAGLLASGFFATAILARLLGQRLMIQEELARRRGIALENQLRINRRILERMQYGVLVVNPDGLVLRHNPEAETLLGIPPGDGLPLANHVPALAVNLVRWQKKGGASEAEVSLGGGNRVGVRFEATDSSAGESLIFIEDLTRVEAQARQLKLAALGRLTASIAHEIRNPLAAISHAADLLAEDFQQSEGLRLLKILRDNVHRLDRIVQDVLRLGVQGESRGECLPLDELMPQLIDEFIAVEKLPASMIAWSPSDGKLFFDRGHFFQILWNLLSNAIRHASGKDASVRLWCERNRSGKIELHICDDGPGIPEALREQVFEPFFTTRHTGVGLGLFIARELCEANSCRLRVLDGEAGGGHFVIEGEAKCPVCTEPRVVS